MNAVKSWIKQRPALVGAYRRISWPVHVLMDQFSSLVWNPLREVTTPLGFKLTSGRHPAYAQMRLGTFEKPETAVILRELKRSQVFVDVGANLGYYSLLALKHQKRVVAFEPQAQNLKCLFRNLEANGWSQGAEVFPMALAERSGVLTLFGASGPSASLVEGWAGYSSRFRQTVPVTTLDRILEGQYRNERLLIKIDVEGAELGVLLGASATLTRQPRPAWLVEVCLNEYHPGGNPNFLAIFELFWSKGYQASIADGARIDRADVERWLRNGRTDTGSFNYLFTAPEPAARDRAPGEG